jgi:hypothetical protein
MMPPESSVRILFVGDMHLGRLPSRVPDAVLDLGALNLQDLGPTAAWERIIEEANIQRVHAVALAGDLVEGDNAMFEAYGPLATGVRRLVARGILVAAVAGNHDTVALPRLAAEIDGFHLLGAGGTWSTVTITGDPGLAVTLAGWSFPARHHSASPLLNPPPDPMGITLGLLHGDLDVSPSGYAPVRTADLHRVSYQGWFLGHVHKPDAVPHDGSPFYLGSVTGLKPTETGSHGPVLVQVFPRGESTARRLALAPLRWEELELDCSDLEDPPGLIESHLLGGMRGLFKDLQDQLDEVRALGVRVTLRGRIADPAAMERALRALDLDRLVTRHEGVVLFVQKITNQVTAQIDLATLAHQADPPGLLARNILALENPGAPVPGIDDPGALVADLVEAARLTLSRVDGDAVFRELSGEGNPSCSEIRYMLARSGRLALAALLDQTARTKEVGHAAG